MVVLASAMVDPPVILLAVASYVLGARNLRVKVKVAAARRCEWISEEISLIQDTKPVA